MLNFEHIFSIFLAQNRGWGREAWVTGLGHRPAAKNACTVHSSLDIYLVIQMLKSIKGSQHFSSTVTLILQSSHCIMCSENHHGNHMKVAHSNIWIPWQPLFRDMAGHKWSIEISDVLHVVCTVLIRFCIALILSHNWDPPLNCPVYSKSFRWSFWKD